MVLLKLCCILKILKDVTRDPALDSHREGVAALGLGHHEVVCQVAARAVQAEGGVRHALRGTGTRLARRRWGRTLRGTGARLARHRGGGARLAGHWGAVRGGKSLILKVTRTNCQICVGNSWPP